MTPITRCSKGGGDMKNKIKQGKDVLALNIIAYSITTIIALLCLIPFIMVISGSLSSEQAIANNGFSILPQEFSPRHP